MSSRWMIAVLVTLVAAGSLVWAQQPSPTTDSAMLLQRVERLEYRLETELKMLEHRFDSAQRTLAIAGGVLGLLLALLTVFREVQHRKLEQRQLAYADQQLDLGKTVLSSSSDMLSRQLDNMGKLGSVIGLVESTFRLQLRREEEQGKIVDQLQTELRTTRQLVEQARQDSRQRYGELATLVLESVGRLSAMDWPTLSDELHQLTLRARTVLETIPPFVIQEERAASPERLARVLQLLGTSAFYANDIDAALRNLSDADQIFGGIAGAPKEPLAQAYTKHFLGVAEKNWRRDDAEPGAHLLAAQRHLREATTTLGPSQFLTRVTLAEVMSYIPGELAQAGELLDKIIKELEAQHATLDRNQRSLLVRALLIRGNLWLVSGDSLKAMQYFGGITERDSKNHYAWLSLAHASTDSEKGPESRLQSWTTGLELLIASGALEKRELTTRVVALAWAITASVALDRRESLERYWRDIQTLANNHGVGHRVPVFFSPLSKNVVEFPELNEQLRSFGASGRH